jgi:DNA-binding NarL/FixJ family response regulator
LLKGSRTTVSLELAKQIAVMHKGHIELGSVEGGGVVIRVALPSIEAAGGRRSRPRTFRTVPPKPAPTSGKPGLLWVDDDATMARGMSRYINTHEVHVVGTLAEARELIGSLPTPPELVLCSVSLPDGLGTALHQEQDLQLAGRFVFITGGVLSGEVANYLKASGCATLIKPLTVAEVKAVLGSDVEHAPYAQTLAQDDAYQDGGYQDEYEDGDDHDTSRATPPEPLDVRRMRRELRRRQTPTKEDVPDDPLTPPHLAHPVDDGIDDGADDDMDDAPTPPPLDRPVSDPGNVDPDLDFEW